MIEHLQLSRGMYQSGVKVRAGNNGTLDRVKTLNVLIPGAFSMKPTSKKCDVVNRDTCAADRRNFIKGTVAGMAAGFLGASSLSEAQFRASPRDLRVDTGAFNETHALKPLPFDAAKLDGLSARLIESHWSNNYGGSVRALNETNRRLAAALADRDLPAYTYNDLKREHLMRTGSVVLHELYFENLGAMGR